jgi:hypothetical protein
MSATSVVASSMSVYAMSLTVCMAMKPEYIWKDCDIHVDDWCYMQIHILTGIKIRDCED